MPQIRFTVSLSPTAREVLDARVNSTTRSSGDRSYTISEMIERYDALLARVRHDIRDSYAASELGLMADACNGTQWETYSIPMLPASIEDAIQYDHLDDKWSVDGAALIARLNTTSIVERYALVDAIERYWDRVERGEAPEYGAILNG